MLSRHAALRYLFSVVMVAVALGLRLLLIPITGTGAPYVIVFAAVVVTSLFAGVGPGILAVVLGAPVGAQVFVVRAGYPPSQAAFQALLFCVDGAVVVYLTFLAKRARASLQQANAELRTAHDERQMFVSLVENSSDFIGIADGSGKPIYVNPAGRRMVGFPSEQPVEQTQIVDYYPPEQRAFATDVIYKTMVERGRFSGETYFRHWQTGEAIPVLDEHFLVRDPSGTRVLGMGTITRDISEMRRTARDREALLHREQEARRQLETLNAKLRESEERFRLIVEEAPIGIALVALDGRFVRVNRVLCEIVGYGADELERLRFQDITHPDDLEADVALVGRLARGEIPRYQLEKRYIRKGGSVVPVLLSVSVLRHPDGSPLYYIVRVEDITERRRAEHISQRLATIVHDSNDAITTQDLNGTILAWNRGAERMYGYSETEALGRNIALIVPEQNTDTLRYLDTVRRGRPAPSVEVKRKTKDGRILDVWLTATPLFEGGQPIAVGTTERDVTERKQREDELRLAEAKSTGILSISADALISIDADQRITMFNQGAERIFGYTKDEILGAPLDVLIPARLRAIHRQHVEGFAAGSAIARRMGDRGAVIVGLRKNGEEFPADAAISKLEIGGTRILTVALRDITDQQRLEEELRRAVQMREEVLAVVAHDLRNPLGTIIMQSDVLRRVGGQPEVGHQRPSEIIGRAANRMKKLIQDLLDFAHLEKGVLRIAETQLAVPELLREVVDSQISQVSKARLVLETEVEPDVPEVWGDRDRLEQVFENLIGNAIKFTDAGGRITVGAKAAEREVLFWVRDTGCGMSTETLSHVFERFWQAKERPGGLGVGLGLPIAKGIVEAHGGRIWVKSTPEQGSTFFFTIPRFKLAEDAPGPTVH